MQSLDDFCSKIKEYKLQKESIEIISYTTKFEKFVNDVCFNKTFSNIKIFPRMYWSHPEDGKIIGFGSVGEYASSEFEYNKLDNFISSIQKSILSNIENHEMIKILGGIAFNQLDAEAKSSDEWQKFPNTYFFLPKIIISTIDNEIFITLNLKLDLIRSSSVKEEFDRLLVKITSHFVKLGNNNIELSHILVNNQNSTQSFDQWKENISKIKILIENSSLEKLVLANSKILQLSKSINIGNCLDYLLKNYSEAYIFALEIEESNIFISATPELLVHKSNGKLISDAIAGSRPRGIGYDEDLKLENDLLLSKKDRKEHKFVVEQIIKKLTDAGLQKIKTNEPYVVKLKNIQHLKAEINADCDKSLPELIQILHPTAAVGGVPSEQALHNIIILENMDRGWYASPVGWITCEDSGKFVVAIRSALVKDLKVVLYAGAGIVSDSDADAEWKEIGVKFEPMMKALGVGNVNPQ
ncbi:MAG: Salicylate biosynthesis isochorismate synthase [Candidatus Heimdallarchaeota archaeon LC_2]|nr:MAG: Salicylate biosynthesis isochorismate synthase [Candidatus Heimdallarchaeota archaeon LC_2]